MAVTAEGSTTSAPRTRTGGFVGPRAGLVLASAAMLFAELMLIRWVAGFQIHVALFTNFVLLASFLGIGVGFLRARHERDLRRWAPLALAAMVALVWVFRVVRSVTTRDAETVFGLPAPPMWVTLPVVFLGVAGAMALVTEEVARRFERFAPLDAYRLDIFGSLLGIVAFAALSFVGAGPLSWGLALAAAFVVLGPRAITADRIRAIGAAALLAILAVGGLTGGDTWSPYYRVSQLPVTEPGRVPIRVNSLPHQSTLPLERLREEFYVRPYEHLQREPGRVLIIGAGNGNDVAVALSEGATSVDAVEIDRVLQGIGRERHPEQPYADPRVTAHVDDGRAFLERTDAEYDLILFALPDSLTLVTGQGALRLESYLFTVEAMTTVRDRLAPGGVFAMYNYYRPDVFERYANTMATVFGHEPCFDPGAQGADRRSQAVLTIGVSPDDVSCETRWTPAVVVPEPATDDHPFPYARGRTIPLLYAVVLGLIVVASIVIVRRASGAPLSRMRPYADLFCMGAAFLLLETTNVVRFALLFGTTWFVNALVFAGILLSVLAAVELARRVRLPSPIVLYVALALAIAVAWVIEPASLLQLDVVPRFFAAVAIAFTPVFIANLIFAERFRDVGASTVAFAANLLGAMLGGVMEYLALTTGYRNLLFVVALVYGLAFILRPRGRDVLDLTQRERRLPGAIEVG
ncbi:MAG TPA: spermidine synthase [Actinomycetota bacterium]|nr:spermidine synthase [Actinomycetota bacterium]